MRKYKGVFIIDQNAIFKCKLILDQILLLSIMIKNVIQSYGSLTIIRVLSRVFEFFLKTYLIRNLLNQQILAHMVHLDMIVTVSLHILKSCLKPAYQKVKDPNKIQKNILSGMNLMNVGVVITTIFSFLVCIFQLYQYENTLNEKRLLNLNYCILFYGFAVVNQAFFEKYNVRNVLQYNYVKSAVIQMVSFLPKTLFIFVAAQTGMFQIYGILVFGIGHFIYTSLLLVVSFLSNPKRNRTFLSCKILTADIQQDKPYQKKQETSNEKKHKRRTDNQEDEQKTVQEDKSSSKKTQAIISQYSQRITSQQGFYYIDEQSQKCSRQFLSLSLLKLAIQQFQKIVLVALDITSFSSTYTLISNLGSIVVRYLFAPLQQIVYNYFSRGGEKESVRTLTLLVKAIALFSMLSLSFGYNYSEPFLGMLYGRKWVDQDTVQALQVYTVLLSVLGINGIMEAFLFAKGINSFKVYNYASVFPAVIYTLLSFYFIRFTTLGTGSFFIANTISMMIRVAISWNLEIKKHVTLRTFLLQIKPSNLFIVSIIITFLLGNPSVPHIGFSRFNSYFKDMIVGGFLFAINMSVILFQNRKLIKQKIKGVLKRKQKKQL